MGPGYFLQCWQEARTGFDRYFYDVWDRYYARLRSYPLLFGASTFKLGCLCAAAAVLLLIVLIWACLLYTSSLFCPMQGTILFRQYRIILSADTASEVRQMPSQKRR